MDKKKILVVLTNTTQFQVKPEATGLWLGEATEFVMDMQKPDIWHCVVPHSVFPDL